MKLPKELMKKYDIEIEGNGLLIHNPDGRRSGCISCNEFEIYESALAFEIKCKTAVITLWKEDHSFHVTIFKTRH